MDQPPQLQPPETFYLRVRDLTIWPHGFAILVYGLFHNPLISQVDTNFSQGTKLFFCYLISLFAFPLLSAIVFTRRVASLKSLFITHLWVSLAMVLYKTTTLHFSGSGIRLSSSHSQTLPLWRLASLPEPVYGAAVAAMEKSKLVIWGVNGVFLYLFMCNGVIN